MGRVLDWSYHHVILSGGLPAADLDRAKTEPRILFHLAERNLPRASVAIADESSLTASGAAPRRPIRPQAQN